jgi:hypothetical protein
MSSSYYENQGSNNTYMDLQYNLMYFVVKPIEEGKSLKANMKASISKLNPFGSSAKPEAEEVEEIKPPYNNIILWDIPKRVKAELFSPDELEPEERLQTIFFEKRFDEEKRLMTYSEPDRVINNLKTEVFEPLNKMLITSYCPQRKQHCLWACSKWGDNKQRLAFFRDRTAWHFDALNQQIRIIEWLDNDVKITEIDWKE